MNVEASLKKIRTQIKHGRIAGINDSLIKILAENYGTEYEPDILEVLTLNFLKIIGGYKDSIPLLERLLSLTIAPDLRIRAEEYLALCKEKENLEPSQPDHNNPDFIEFMTHLRSKKISFHPKEKIDAGLVFEIRDIEEAKKIAWHQSISPPFQSWNGLRAIAAKQVYDHYFENKINMDFIDDEISVEIEKICSENVPFSLLDFNDDIYGDLIEIARGKLIRVTSPLHEKMWGAYKNNFFPCGWRGEFPNGNLCVFSF